MVKRVIFVVALLILMFYLPIWLFVFAVLLGMFLFDFFWEGVFVYIFSQLLFGLGNTSSFSFLAITLLLPIAVIYLIEFLKNKLKFYNK